jgi:hypothetical protein
METPGGGGVPPEIEGPLTGGPPPGRLATGDDGPAREHEGNGQPGEDERILDAVVPPAATDPRRLQPFEPRSHAPRRSG